MLSSRFVLATTSLLLVLFAFHQGVHAATILGKVTDESNRALAGTTVTLNPISRQAMTGPTGQFSFSNVSQGSYELAVHHVGYAGISEIQILVSSDADTVWTEDLALRQSDVELPAIVVTATRTPRLTTDISKHVSVVSSQQIADRGVKTSADALREEAGVFIQKTNQGGGNAIIRGQSASKVLLLVDGIRINNSTYRVGHHQYLATVSPEMLEQIEVVHGPTSTQYGSDGFGGAINLISKTPALSESRITTTASILSQASSADGVRSGSAIASVSGRHAALTARGGYKEIGDVRQGKHFGSGLSILPTGETLQPHNGYFAREFDGKALFALNNATQIVAAAQSSRLPRVPRYDKFALESFYRWDYVGQNRDLMYLSVDRIYSNETVEALRLTASLQHQQEGRETQSRSSAIITSELDETRTIGIIGELRSKLRNHQILYGGEAYFDLVRSRRLSIDPVTSVSSAASRGRYPDMSKYATLGVFAQDEWSVSEKTKLTAGLRWNSAHATMPFPSDSSLPTILGSMRQTYSAFTASTGLLYRITNTLSFLVNASQGFHAPNLNDLSKMGESQGLVFEVPNPNLKPERLKSLDFGMRMSSHSWSGQWSFYYNWVSELIETTPALYNGSPTITKDTLVYKVKAKSNIGDAQIYGLELSIARRLSPSLRAKGNIAFTHGYNVTAKEPVGSIPPITGLIGLTCERQRFHTEIFGRFASAQRRLSSDDRDDPRIPEGGTPAWYTVNLRGSLRTTDWMRVRIAVENVFDRLYREHGSGVNAAGRNLIGSLELTF